LRPSNANLADGERYTSADAAAAQHIKALIAPSNFAT
jgi:hypothetical protein